MPRFFQETFFVANTKFEVILEILFLKISNTDILFGKKILTWKIYTTNKALLITKEVQIINPKKFIIAAFDVYSKTFVVHVVIRKQEKMPVHFEKQAHVGALIFNKAPIKVIAEYSDYNIVFLMEYVAKLLENIRMNKHAIKLEESK